MRGEISIFPVKWEYNGKTTSYTQSLRQHVTAIYQVFHDHFKQFTIIYFSAIANILRNIIRNEKQYYISISTRGNESSVG